MLNYTRPAYCTLLAVGILFLGGCRKSSEGGATAPPQTAPAPVQSAPATERHHGMFTGGISPLIVSMSPQTIPFHDGHVPPGRYSLTYEINNSEKATKAFISVYAAGVGEVQKFDVDVQPRAQIEFILDASNVDMGPTVRFRAHCPYGDTDWFIMGSNPVDYSQRMASKQIGNVTPGYIETRRGTPGGGVAIQIWGSQITQACTPEAQVDGTTVELRNVFASDKRITGVLMYSDLQGRPVAGRYLEVRLVVTGPGMPAEDVYNLDFVE